ncbi:TRAP transporter small permease [Azospirillum sp. SYSU D00513]|uniref:TRAP transporter small permease n=1 Tax=Azospirillum sp. SYSU D00513 TaxID=2812561 RepID=UPI001A95FA98|nr:TRAP transporter small permease [Azospirillum sp. SYSU D00513]
MTSFYRYLCKAEAVVAGLFLVLMVVLIFCGGVARLMHYPINWANDVATCLFAWACFLCADIAWRRDSLMSIDLLTARASPGVRRAVATLNHAIIALFLVFLIVAGVWLSWTSRARSFQGIPEISYSWVTMSLPVGAALLLITCIGKMRREFQGGAGLHEGGLKTENA